MPNWPSQITGRLGRPRADDSFDAARALNQLKKEGLINARHDEYSIFYTLTNAGIAELSRLERESG